MFHLFSRKSESPQKELLPTESPETPAVADLREQLQITSTQNAILLEQAGLPSDIRSIFTPDALSDTDITPIDGADNDRDLNTEEISENTPDIEPTTSEQLIGYPQSFESSSENELINLLKEQYNTTHFRDTTHNVLVRRGIPEENVPQTTEKILKKMALRTIDNFKGDMAQNLNEHGLGELDVDNYIYWRLNEYPINNPLYIITDGKNDSLSADNFISPELLSLFQQNQESIIFDGDAFSDMTDETMQSLSEEQDAATREAEEKYRNLLNDLEKI